MKNRPILFATLLLLSQSANAWFITPPAVVAWCEARVKDTDIELGNACVGYVAAVHDTWDLAPTSPYCLPAGVSADDLAKAVVDHAAAGVAEPSGSAAEFVTSAYKAAWPCR
jgi:hypothetical protein